MLLIVIQGWLIIESKMLCLKRLNILNTQTHREDAAAVLCVCVRVCACMSVYSVRFCIEVMHGDFGVVHSVISYNIGTPVMCFSVFRLYVCLQVCVSVFVGCVGGVGMHT